MAEFVARSVLLECNRAMPDAPFDRRNERGAVFASRTGRIVFCGKHTDDEIAAYIREHGKRATRILRRRVNWTCMRARQNPKKTRQMKVLGHDVLMNTKTPNVTVMGDIEVDRVREVLKEAKLL